MSCFKNMFSSSKPTAEIVDMVKSIIDKNAVGK